MQMLAAQIARDINERGLSAVYDSELNRVWPKNGRRREEQIQAFAKQHGWRLRHYKDGFVAIFDADLPIVSDQ
jgi:hypothetical protein